MSSLFPTLVWGVFAPIVVLVGAVWLLRRWKNSMTEERNEYTGAMGSPALEAMMELARRQREQLQSQGRDPDDESPSGGS